MATELNSTSLLTDSNLQGYWRFENSLADSGPNGYTLTNNLSTDTTGEFGHGRAFGSASGAYVTTAGTALNIKSKQTWGCWFKATINNNSWLAGIRNSTGGDARGLALDSVVANTVRFEMDGLTTNAQVNSGTISNDGNFHLVIGVYSGTSLNIYYDNVKTVAACSGTPNAITSNFSIGRLGDFTTTPTLNGTVDEFFFFNRDFTDSDAALLWATPSGFRKQALMMLGLG